MQVIDRLQLRNLERIDYGTNFEQFSSQNIWTQLKFENNTWNQPLKKTWTQLNFDKNTLNQLNYLCFYRHKDSSIFLPPQFFLYPKFELCLKYIQRRLVNHH